MSIDAASPKTIRSVAAPERRELDRSSLNDGPFTCPYCDRDDVALYFQGRTAIILRCRRCGGLYDPNRRGEIIPDDAVAERVAREYISSYRDNESAELAIARGVIGLLRHRLPTAKRYLELGSGNAAIARIATVEGLPITYVGVELSSALYAAIDPALSRLVIHEQTLEAALDRVEDRSQDVVILHHVLEHLPDPRRTLALIRPKLAAGGVFFIEVPNEQWKRAIIHLRRILKRAGDDWFPGHINFFTQESLRNFLLSQGFHIEYERKVAAAQYIEMVKKMLGGETAFRTNIPARIVHAGLRWTKLESLIGYGIVLRCICRPKQTERSR